MTEIPVNSVFPAGRPPQAPPDAPADGDFMGLFRSMHEHLGRIAQSLPSPALVRKAEAENVWSIDIDPVPIVIAGGFGVLDVPEFFSPNSGEHWDVHTVSCTGFTAGSVLGWLNLPAGAVNPANTISQQGALRVVFSSAGVNTYGKNQVHLRPTDRLVWVASGITVPAGGQVLVSLGATRVAEPYWGRYLI
jgi:hypothetical protein